MGKPAERLWVNPRCDMPYTNESTAPPIVFVLIEECTRSLVSSARVGLLQGAACGYERSIRYIFCQDVDA